MTILVTAAGGNQGRLLVPKLLQRGRSVRANVLTEASAARLRELGVDDIVVGDLRDPEVQRQAVQGVDKIYHVGATGSDERTLGLGLVDAARIEGVSHFVFSSVLHAIITDLKQHEYKRDIEEHLLSSDLEFTILQPTNYMLPLRLRPVFARGVFELSWSLDRKQSLVDLDDVTDVAATVLTDTARHAGATYELAAPGRLDAHELCDIISRVLDRPIELREITPETYANAWLRDVDPETAEHVLSVVRSISARYSAHDFVGNANVLTWLLGCEPTSYEQFVEREWSAFRAAQTVSA
ncbi:NmrA family NAD(P)-binding protein [Subtercola lobariae]|uniref:Epimerase n=1 Tax=Subtercola lobariae TaxID=1588641 RepID=A0A917F068_9MICO|nr:NmrA family NAD(P)-binding protein [Subtercola lobariae]GGF31746.1 epimerase [Subtercola lobariae]